MGWARPGRYKRLESRQAGMEVAMTLTLQEAREWFQMRKHVREAVMHLEVCHRRWRVRELTHPMRVGRAQCCRPGDTGSCLGK